MELVRYIHLNTVRSKLVERPERWRYSGHGVYLRGKPTEMMDPQPVFKLLGGPRAYRKFVLKWGKDIEKNIIMLRTKDF